MAATLRPFSINPHVIRLVDGSAPRGYAVEDFAHAFDLYLPPSGGAATPATPLASLVAPVAPVAGGMDVWADGSPVAEAELESGFDDPVVAEYFGGAAT